MVGDRVVTRKSDPNRSSRRAPTPTKAKGVRTRAKSKLQVARESGAWEFVEPCVPSCRIEDCSLQVFGEVGSEDLLQVWHHDEESETG